MKDILPFAQTQVFAYENQRPLPGGGTTFLSLGSSFTIDLDIDENVEGNVYTWFKDGTELTTTNTNSLTIADLSLEDAGTYTATITNPTLPDLALAYEGETLVAPCSLLDSLSLVAIYQTAGGDAWTNNTNWLQAGQPISSWFGITVNEETGCVSSLDLPNNNLVGIMPNELGDLGELISLNINDNQVTQLVALPANLTSLASNSNQIFALPELPSALTTLRCSDNQISVIPTLPSTLRVLECNSNRLANLPALPANLLELDCSINQINPLPLLPPNLTALNCATNQLEQLPLLPTSLATLLCQENQLIALPNLPQSLTLLNCGANLIPTLPTLPNNLEELRCSSNQLTVLPGLPNGLLRLFCDENQLTTLDGLPSTLQILDASSNELVEFPAFSQLSNLTNLDLSTNSIRGLIPKSIGDLTNMGVLNISDNELKGAVPNEITQLANLAGLFIANNNILSLPDLTSITALKEVNAVNNILRFESIIPNLPITTFNYIPQNPLSVDFKYFAVVGGEARLDIYENNVNPHPDNVYAWRFIPNGDPIISTERRLMFNTTTLNNDGVYRLTITNGNVPNLELSGTAILSVAQNDLPFADDELIVKISRDMTDTEVQQLRDKYNVQGVDSCRCLTEDFPFRLELWEFESILDLNDTRMGVPSEIDQDTTELNFELEPLPEVQLADCEVIDPTLPAIPVIRDFNPINIGVIGSGIDRQNTLLSNRLYQSQGELACDTIQAPLDCDHNCYNNDLNGYDFTTESGRYEVTNPHETHIAGIIASNLPASVNLEIVDAKVFGDDGNLFDLICSFHYLAQHEAEPRIINASLGFNAPDPSQSLFDAIKRLEDRGRLVVISAGNNPGQNNDETPRWPGNFGTSIGIKDTLSNLIVVASTNQKQDGLADFSNIGPNSVDVAAAGTLINSFLLNNEEGRLSGTSQAAANITRLASLLWAHRPRASYTEIKDAILKFTVEETENSAFKDQLRYGKVSCENAVESMEFSDEVTEIIISAVCPKQSPPIPDLGRPDRLFLETDHIIKLKDDDVVTLRLGDGTKNYGNVLFEICSSNTYNAANVVGSVGCQVGKQISWDGKDPIGDPVNSGRYFMFVRVNGTFIKNPIPHDVQVTN